MINRLKQKYLPIYIQYQSIIRYIFFGIVTTLVNYLVYFICKSLFHLTTGPANGVAWLIAVLTAFITNKLYVFESKSWAMQVLAKEFVAFFTARLLSFLLDMGIVVAGVDILHINDFIIKTISNIFVLILNYIASKWFIFKKKPRYSDYNDTVEKDNNAMNELAASQSLVNDTIKSILERRSIREYKQNPVEKEKLDLIVKAGLYAPSAMNVQPWHITVVTDSQVIGNITEACREFLAQSEDINFLKRLKDGTFAPFHNAPAVIIVSGESKSKFKECDCANVTQNMALAAYAVDLGSCYIASFTFAFAGSHKEELYEQLKIPHGYEPLYSLSIGYINGEIPEAKPRKENAVTYID